MPPQQLKKVKCKYYNLETGNPDPIPCPRSSKVCWFIHPNEPEWNGTGGGGKRLSSPPRRYGGGRKRSLSPRRGRGRSRSRSMSRDRKGRSRVRSRSRGYVSPERRRRRPSSPIPPRRPLHERIQRSHSPRPRSSSRARSRSPPRHPRNRRPRSPTPISSSRGHTPPKRTRSDHSPRAIKLEPSTDNVPSVSSNLVSPVLDNTNTGVGGDQPPIPPRDSVDQHHQPLSLNLSSVERATTASTSLQPPSPQTAPFSPIFAPETPIIPGLSASARFAQPQTAVMSALQKSLEQVIKDQATNQTTQPSITPPVGIPSTSPGTSPDGEKTEIWTTRVKLWADLMKAKSEIVDWEEEAEVAQSLKNRAGFETFSPEVQAQINSRITYARGNLVRHQLAFEALVSQSIALDRNVSKVNAALTPASAVPNPRTTTPREIEWMEERIQTATARMDELESKLRLQDQLLERLKAEQEAVAALPPLPSTASPRSPMDVDDGDGILDRVSSLKRKRTDDDETRPSSRRRSLARDVADLREANEALVDRIAEAEGTIEGFLNDVVEDPEGEESSRAIRLKEIFQDYQAFAENAKTSIETTERNSRVVEVLKTEAERAIADWNEVYQEFEVVQKESVELHARGKERAAEIAKKEEKTASMQREIEALNVTVQAFVEQQSAQPETPLTLEQVVKWLKPFIAEEMREATRPLLTHKHEELQRILTDYIEAVRVSIYEPIRLSEQVARTMVTWLEAEFGYGATKR